MSPKTQLSRYIDELRKRHMDSLATPENAEDLFIADQELKGMISSKLGYTYDPRKVEGVSSLHHELQIARLALGNEVMTGKVSSEEFFRRFTAKMSSTFAECEGILGKHDFEILFDGTPDECSRLIEPNILFGLNK